MSRRKYSSGRVSPPVDVNCDSNVKKFESLTMPVLVLVYADWCGHCQRYKTLWKKLSQDPNRSLNMAAVRDDMVSKTSLTQRSAPVSSYPTVMLIGKNGKAVNFKSPEGIESEAIPNHNDMETMTAIVRNAGTEAGEAALNEPAAMPPNISADVVQQQQQQEQPQKGGSLFDLLSKTAYSAAPALVLGASALVVAKKTRKSKGRSRKHSRSRKHRRAKN